MKFFKVYSSQRLWAMVFDQEGYARVLQAEHETGIALLQRLRR